MYILQIYTYNLNKFKHKNKERINFILVYYLSYSISTNNSNIKLQKELRSSTHNLLMTSSRSRVKCVKCSI